jgi:hypothetical protein
MNHRIPLRLSWIAAISLLLLLSTVAVAQVTTARLEGVVKDVTDAIIPGAVVVATNQATNMPYETFTNEVGYFVLPQLPPGTYTVACELVGFKRSLVQDLVLQVGDTSSVELVLQPGDITEEVVVTSEVAPVDLTSQNIRSVVQERQIIDLPLNGRNAMNLFYLQAGASPLVSCPINEFK